MGATARARSPSKVVMLLTRLVRPEGKATTRSPGQTLPAAICPAEAAVILVWPDDPLNRQAKGGAGDVIAGGTVSRYSSSVGPWYHGIWVPRSTWRRLR